MTAATASNSKTTLSIPTSTAITTPSLSSSPPAPASTTYIPTAVAEFQAVYDALKDERILREENLDVKRQELEVARTNLAAESQAGSVPSLEAQSSVETAQQAVEVAETAVNEIMSQEAEASNAFESAAASASAGEASAAAAQRSDAKWSDATLIAVVVAATISIGMIATLVGIRMRAKKIPEQAQNVDSFENPMYESSAGYLDVGNSAC